MSDLPAQNLRVVVVNNFSGPNIGRYGLRAIPLVKGLIAAGARVGVVAAAGSGFAHAAIEAGAEVTALEMSPTRSGRVVREIKNMAWRMNANLIVGTSTFTNLMTRQAAPDLTPVVNIVSRIPGPALALSGWRVRFSLKRLIGRAGRKEASVHVALSQAVADALVETGLPRKMVRVIPNGLDADAFVQASVEITGSGTPRMPEDDPKLAGHPLVFAVARNLLPSKGVDVLVEAAAQVLRDWPEGEGATSPAPNFRVAGTGADKEALIASIAAEHIADRFEIMGFAPQISPWYRDCDIAVMPSRSEAVAVVALEAMAHGKPVIASAVGGIPEVVIDGETGVLVPSGDPEALAVAITGLLSDPERARALGQAGARRVRECFSETKMIEDYITLFNSLIG